MASTYLSFPFQFTPAGAVATADFETHLRQRIEQVLFTSPGERVMLPEFGCGARSLVFKGNNAVLAAATEFTIAKALQSTLGSQLMVHAVNVRNEEEVLHVEVVYTKSRDLERERLVFQLLPFAGDNRA
jgi:phage baseplate assembly protein W